MMHSNTRSDAYSVSGLRRPLAIKGYVQILELTSCLFIFRSHSRTRHVNLHKSLVTTRRPVTDFIRRAHTYQGGTYCQRIKDDFGSNLKHKPGLFFNNQTTTQIISVYSIQFTSALSSHCHCCLPGNTAGKFHAHPPHPHTKCISNAPTASMCEAQSAWSEGVDRQGRVISATCHFHVADKRLRRPYWMNG